MYISIDGDEIGKIIERYILNEDLKSLRKFSNNITNSIRLFEEFIKNVNGKIFLVGGDNIFASVSKDRMQELLDFVNKVNTTSNVKFSVGYSTDILSTYLALKYAKSLKRGALVFLDNNDGENHFVIFN